MTVLWADRDRLLIEVVMNVPMSESQVERTPETDALRRRLERDVREMMAEGIMPEGVKD